MKMLSCFLMSILLFAGQIFSMEVGYNSSAVEFAMSCDYGALAKMRDNSDDISNKKEENLFIDLNKKDEIGNTPLINACLKNDVEAVSFLISVGVDLNGQNNNGYTALRCAINNNNENIVYLLIKAGANVNLPDTNKYTPLMQACIVDNKNIVKVLLDNDADFNLKANAGVNAFLIINEIVPSGLSKSEIVKIMINKIREYKAKVYLAIEYNNLKDFKSNLLKVGSISFKDQDGNNLLHYAALHKNEDIFGLILSIKPSLLFQKNNKGFNAYEFLIKLGDNVMAKKIHEYIMDGVINDSCYICMDDIVKQEIYMKNCNHNVMHKDCLKDWMKSKDTCPMCRRKIEFVKK